MKLELHDNLREATARLHFDQGRFGGQTFTALTQKSKIANLKSEMSP